jgi:hypothetical protein
VQFDGFQPRLAQLVSTGDLRKGARGSVLLHRGWMDGIGFWDCRRVVSPGGSPS